MSGPDVPPTILALLERIAWAICRELGEAIDAYPGCHSPEQADPINRAFHAIVRSLVEMDIFPSAKLVGTVSLALRVLAEHRLAAECWNDCQIKSLIEEEPGSPDDWLAFLILSCRMQIEPLLDPNNDQHA